MSLAPRDLGRSNLQSGEGGGRGRRLSYWNMMKRSIQLRTCSTGSKGSCFLMTGHWEMKIVWRWTGAVGALAADILGSLTSSYLRVRWEVLHMMSAVGSSETIDTRGTYWNCVAQRTLADRVCAVDALLRSAPSGSCRNSRAHPSPQRSWVVDLH